MTAGCLLLLLVAGLTSVQSPSGGNVPSPADTSVQSLSGGSVPSPADSGVRLWQDTSQGRREITTLAAADGVSNPVLGVLVSLIDRDLYGRVSQVRLRQEAQEHGEGRIPWKYFLWIRRQPIAEQHHPEVTVRFLSALAVPIPYAILGYHPGRMRTSQRVVVDEWPMGDWSWKWEDEEGSQLFVAEQVELFALREGQVEIDVDGFVDWILGGRLDDIRITGMLLFSHEGSRYGLAFGYNPEGQGRSGVLDLGRDKILFPPPKPFLSLGRRMRSIAEARQLLESQQEKAGPAPPR